MKIVSLLPSATEMVYALGLEDALAGVTHECDYPPPAREKTVVSTTSLPATSEASATEIDRLVSARVAAGEPLYSLHADRIREIRPDLILAQDLCAVCAVPSGQVNDALDVLGCRAEVISLDPNTIDEVIDGLVEVGRAAGVEGRAESLVASLRERVAAVEDRARDLQPVRTVALEWPEPPFCGGHWVPEMIRRAGGTDVLGAEGAPSRRVTWDEIEAAAPDVVVYMPCGYYLEDAVAQARDLYEHETFARLPAARTGRVVATDASAYFSRPGPRVVDGLEILAWALHPDAFPAPAPGRAVVVERGRS